MPVDGIEKDYVKIAYAGTDSLYVPATQLDLITKYIGGGEDTPIKLSKNGRRRLDKSQIPRQSAAKEMAKELIALYAERQRLKGHALPLTPFGSLSLKRSSDTRSRTTRSGAWKKLKPIWNSKFRWTAFFAAMSATEKPRWRCAR